MKTVFLQILDMSVSASILAAVVIVLRLVLKKAPKAIHCALWAMVALRLVCPSLPESQASLMPDSQPVSAVVQGQLEKEPAAEVQIPVQNVQKPALIPQASAPQNTVTVKTELERAVDWMAVVSAVWLSGVGAMALYGVGSYVFLRRKVAPAVKENGVWLCDHLASPFILGILRPRIYLPSGLEMEHRASVLAHEKAHLRRKDHWWKPLGFALLAVHWFNPVMWVAYVLLCRDIEAACDERVVKGMEPGERKAYSEALLSCAAPRRSIAACPLAFGEQGVKGRIKSVLSYKKPTIWIILSAVVASVAVGVFFLTDPRESNDTTPSTFIYGLAGNVEAVYFTKTQELSGLPGSYYERYGILLTEQKMDELCQMIAGKQWHAMVMGSPSSEYVSLPVLNGYESITFVSPKWKNDTQTYTLIDNGHLVKLVDKKAFATELTDEEEALICELRENATQIETGARYYWSGTEDAYRIYFKLFDESVEDGLPDKQKVSYYTAEIQAEEWEILQGLAGSRAWMYPGVASEVGAWKGAVNLGDEGKWTVLTLYDNGIMSSKGYSPYTQEEKALIDVLIERAEPSETVSLYFNYDHSMCIIYD